MTAETLSDTAVTIILDWSRPWAFITELRAWMLLLYRTTSGLETSEQHVLEDNNAIWRRCRDFHGSTRTAESIANLPLAPGEFDQPIGIPINVICCNTQAVEKLEKEQGFKEPDFDYILQYLRTILLKHGAGLIYTMPTQPGQLHALILQSLHIGYNNPGHESLANDYHSTLKHNVVDRERILVPPGWDSWGKIRIVGEGFDIEGTSKVWLQESSEDGTNSVSETVYTTRIPNPKAVNNVTTGIEIQHLPDQEFLAAQSKVLANLQLEDEANKKKQAQKANVPENNNGQSSISDHIGPVQFNMGGIQYDADEALRRIRVNTPERRKRFPELLTSLLQERAKDAVTTVSAQSTPDRQRTRETTPFTPISPPQFEAGKDIPVENLEAYFASLVKGGRSSNSPRAVGSPRVVAKPSALSEVTSDTQS